MRPVLEYADVVWDNCTNYEKQELDKIQTQVARIVTGATKLVSLHTLYKEVNLEVRKRAKIRNRYNQAPHLVTLGN